jgi:hypothetical protein
MLLASRARSPRLAVVSLEEALDALRAHQVTVEIVHPDRAAENMFASVDGTLDPSIRAAAARGGRDEGRRLARTSLSGRARSQSG